MAAPDAPALYQGVSRSSAAFRLLRQMGWQEGEGLGKEKQGITEHVRVSKKKDNAGIGVDAHQKAASNWTFNTSTFDNILKSLKVIVADSEKEATGEPLKVPRLENKDKLKKATRPQGRYKNRESGKVLKGKLQVDLDAILGYRNKERDKMPVIQAPRNDLGERMLEGATSNSDSDTRGRQEHSELATMEQPSEEFICRVLGNDWWGIKHGFVRGGLLGDSARSSRTARMKANGRTAFCEEDQENLYKLVQDKATKGHHGLGIGDHPRRIGGVHWKGQKVTLLDASEDDDGYQIDDDQEGRTLRTELVIDKRKAECSRNLETSEKVKSKRLKGENKELRKWKSACCHLLQEIPGKMMSIKQLHKQIVGTCDLFPNLDSIEDGGAILLLKEKLSRSSKFIVTRKKVSLTV